MESFVYKKAAGVTALTARFSDFRYKKHSHEEYAIGVTLRGVQQYNLGGSLQSSCPGDIMLFQPEQVHDGRSQKESGVDYIMVYIGRKLFSDLTGIKGVAKFPAPLIHDRGLERRVRNLVGAIFSGEEESRLSDLLLSVAEPFAKSPERSVQGDHHVLMDRAKEMIYDNLGVEKILKLDEVAGEIHMSKYQFIRAFQAHAGISPYQFYLNCKVEKAKRLIETSKDVYQAVAELGFVDLSHLNRNFKTRYGVTAFDYLSAIN